MPFQVSGDDPNGEQKPEDYILLSPSANRAKSWSCEHCKNWLELKDPEICSRCYWASLENYDHVAMKEIRRIDVVWQAEEAKDFDAIKERAKAEGKTVPKFVKDALKIIPNSN